MSTIPDERRVLNEVAGGGEHRSLRGGDGPEEGEAAADLAEPYGAEDDCASRAAGCGCNLSPER